MKELGIRDLWQTSTQNPYLFPLNFWMTPKLWDGESELEPLLRKYLAESYGPGCVESGLRYLETMERAWEMVQRETHYQAGFLGLFVMTFPNRMLPEKMMRQGVPEGIRKDLAEAESLAERALKAAEEFSESLHEFHALEANILTVSAEVFYHRVKMRAGKVPVLDALHRGDGKEAVRAWGQVQRACEDMVAAARSAPNTDVLVKHWRRFELLPARMKALAQHLPELAEKKSFRPILQPLYIGNLYGEDKKK